VLGVVKAVLSEARRATARQAIFNLMVTVFYVLATAGSLFVFMRKRE
jgi:hypothetical protein